MKPENNKNLVYPVFSKQISKKGTLNFVKKWSMIIGFGLCCSTFKLFSQSDSSNIFNLLAGNVISSGGEILADPSFQLTFDSVQLASYQHYFKPIRGSQINVAAGAAYWLRFIVSNTDSLTYYRHFMAYNKSIERLQLFTIDDQGKTVAFPMKGVAFPSDAVNENELPNFWIAFAARTTYTLYLYVDQRDLPLITSFLLVPTVRGGQINAYKQGIWVGLSLAYFILALILFLRTKKPLFGAYLLYTFGGVGYFVSTSGIGYTMVWSNFLQFEPIADNVFGMIGGIGFYLTAIYFFDTPRHFPLIDKYLKVSIVFILCSILLGLFRKALPYGMTTDVWLTTMIVSVIGLPFVLIVAIKSYLSFKHKDTLLFLLILSSLSFLIICILLTELGFTAFQNLAHNLLLGFTLLFELSIMSYILLRRIKEEWTTLQLKELQLQQTITAQRQQISQDLHDDVGSTLYSISLFSEIAKQSLHDVHSESYPILEKIGDSSRHLIDTINDIVWAISPNNDQFENITLRMQLFAADMFMQKDIRLNFETDDQLATINLNVEKRKHFYLIFKEAIHNILKYAACQNVSIRLWQKEGNICMTITDDGKGFDQSLPQNGNGLITIQARARFLDGSLQIKSLLQQGTSISLCFPIADKLPKEVEVEGEKNENFGENTSKGEKWWTVFSKWKRNKFF